MLNNFCFHVYAQKSLFKVENVNVFFGPQPQHHPPLEFRVHRAGSQLKNYFGIIPHKLTASPAICHFIDPTNGMPATLSKKGHQIFLPF